MDTIYGRRRGYLFIAERMKEQGLSDEKLALRLDVARETVTRYRKQQHRLNPDKIAAIAAAMGIEPEDLFRPPSARPSLDAMVRGAPDELQDTVADVVKRLISQR